MTSSPALSLAFDPDVNGTHRCARLWERRQRVRAPRRRPGQGDRGAHGRAPRGHQGCRAQPLPPPRPRHRGGRAHQRPGRHRRGPRHRPRGGGHRRHRAGPRADLHRPRPGQAGRDGEQGTARQRRRRAVHARRRVRRRPAVRGGGGRRYPHRAGAAREPARRADHAGDGHRQRHHQLHPHEDDRPRRHVRGGARRSAAARLRRTRPDGRRRGLRRRGQGGDHGVDRVRLEGGGRPRLPRGHQQRHECRHRGGPTPRLRGQAARHRRSRGRRRGGRVCACTRRWCPRRTHWRACATATTPCSSRAVRSVR